jgi:hypothetical protein
MAYGANPPFGLFSGLCPPLHLADIDWMQVCLLGQALLAQACVLTEGANIRTDVFPNLADSWHALARKQEWRSAAMARWL